MEQGIAFEQDYLALNYTRGITVSNSKLDRAAAQTASHIADIEAQAHQPGAHAPKLAATAALASDAFLASQEGGVHHFFGGNGAMDIEPATVVEGYDAAAANDRDSMQPVATETPAIFQATFMDGGAVAKADVIEYVGGGQWDIVEVKSCSDRHVDAYLLDLSFTVYVATRAGLNVRRACLVAVSSTYRFGMPRITVVTASSRLQPCCRQRV